MITYSAWTSTRSISSCKFYNPGYSDLGGCNFIGNHGPYPNNNMADYGAIGGGQCNQIDANGASTPYGVIGGGQCNFIGAGVNHGSIFGGSKNKITASCSAILGGSGNCDNGNPFTGIFGNGLIATVSPATMGVPSAMWVDELIMPNIPVDTTPTGTGPFAALPQGALYTNVPLGSGFLASQVYIK